MQTESYQGLELGPIRPPSEASSLMLRVTRNCPWNRCKFCSLYQGQDFSMRRVEDIIKDIDALKHYTDLIQMHAVRGRGALMQLQQQLQLADDTDVNAFQSAYQWLKNGMNSVFLQDGNSIIFKPSDLVQILNHLKTTFPQVERITTYARSKNLYRMKDEDLASLAQAGLNRIHIGMESGSDAVLNQINKGVTKAEQILAGKKVKQAGIELSVYYMPGLGGQALSYENAIETADVFNQVNPDFIRLRTLAIPKHTELYQDVQAGEFQPLGDYDLLAELRTFLTHIDGIDSVMYSDHILNLLQEINGQFPQDKVNMLAVIARFLGLAMDEQTLYLVGRRTGVFSKLDDLTDSELRPHAEYQVRSHQITAQNVEQFTQTMMQRFI